MTNYFKQKNIDLDLLVSLFKAWSFSCFEISSERENHQNLTVFCCQTQSSENMQQEWMGINSYIAAEYLCKNIYNIDLWNTYLLFVCAEKIPQHTQYEIENNKFSMRKIVADKQNRSLSVDELSNVASQKILSSNIQLTEIELNTELKPNLSEITARLLESGIGLGQSQSDRDSRELWLSDELGRLKTNED